MTAVARTGGARVLEPGARIGRKLEVLRPLGEGGMGTLWVARNLATEAEVAIKVLRPQRESDRDEHTAERFRHEAKVGAMLAHRNITRVYDLIEDEDGSLVLVMELLRGETLEAAFHARGTFSCKDAIAVLVPVLEALQHAHEHGVVHRDLKPSNVILHVDPDGHETPKLLDFGVAKMGGSSITTQAGNVLGTPCYMSPEQVRASAKLDGRSDLFAAASVLYELTTGENPFRTDSPSATLAQVLELEVDPDPRIEPRVWLEVKRALSKQPYQRHESAAAFAIALCEAAGEPLPVSLRSGALPMVATPPAAIIPTPIAAQAVAPPLARARTATAYVAALVLVLGGALLAVAALRKPSVDTPRPAVSAHPQAIAPTASEPAPEPPVSAPPSMTAAPSASEVGGARAVVPTRTPAAHRVPSPTAPARSVSPVSSVARTPGF